VLVLHDLLGLYGEFAPRFVRRYADLGGAARDGLAAFAADVRAGRFPGPENTYEA
jgi:3-methyl-2-oxobutanoate hydroxymethyltransferase